MLERCKRGRRGKELLPEKKSEEGLENVRKGVS